MTLAERARKLKEISPLMKNRTKLETRAITEKPLTIMEADIINEGTAEEYCVVVFKEYPDQFLFGGLVLTHLIKDLKVQLNAEGLSLEDEIKTTTEPLIIRLVPRRGKNTNRGYTDVEVL